MMIVETDESIHQWHNEVGGHAWHITYASSSAELAQATGVKLPSLAPRSACRLYAVRPRAGGSRTRRPMVQPAVQELPEFPCGDGCLDLLPRASNLSMSNRRTGFCGGSKGGALGGLLSASGGGSSHREGESATERYAMRPHCTKNVKGEKVRKIRTKIH